MYYQTGVTGEGDGERGGFFRVFREITNGLEFLLSQLSIVEKVLKRSILENKTNFTALLIWLQ